MNHEMKVIAGKRSEYTALRHEAGAEAEEGEEEGGEEGGGEEEFGSTWDEAEGHQARAHAEFFA